jgi:hypothetical protein
MVADRYSEMSFWQWIRIKKVMLFQSFLPLHHTVAQIRLNSDFGAGIIDKMRAWDFMLLSKGNLAVPFLAAIAILGAIVDLSLNRKKGIRFRVPFLVLIGVSLSAWLIMVIGFFAPLVIPVWPQAALFGLALGGGVTVYERQPVIFKITLFAVMTYTGIVWILSPLKSALAFDYTAALFLFAIVSWVLMSKLMPMKFRL